MKILTWNCNGIRARFPLIKKIIELEKQILIAEEKNLQFSKTEFNKLKNDIETYKVNNKNFEQIINKQKEKILELKSANLIFEKELKKQMNETTPQKKSDGIVATFSGNLLYEPIKKRIILSFLGDYK